MELTSFSSYSLLAQQGGTLLSSALTATSSFAAHVTVGRLVASYTDADDYYWLTENVSLYVIKSVFFVIMLKVSIYYKYVLFSWY